MADPSHNDVRDVVHGHLVSQVLSPADAAVLTDETALLTGGILDSITTLQLVVVIEDRFGVSLRAHEVSVDNFDSIAAIVELVSAKLGR